MDPLEPSAKSIFLVRWITLPLEMIGGLVWMTAETVRESIDHLVRGRAPFRASIFFAQADRTGVGSLPLVALVSFFLGVTMAILTGYELRKYGTQNLVPGLIAVGFTRELGPLITGIMVAARIGAAYTAELGTMTVNEEVEAIESMGIGPLRLLVSPRVAAVALLMPCLAILSSVSAILGGALVCHHQLDFSYAYFNARVFENLIVRDILAGELKAFLFGLIIGVISCYKGLTVTGGAAGVGTSTTASVVSAVTCVIAADTLFNIVMTLIYE